MNTTKNVTTQSADHTLDLGRQLAKSLLPGDVVLLEGDLGAGKTVLVRGIVKGLNSNEHVSSPTFVLIHEYRADIPVAHVDLYRLSGLADLMDLGLEEYLDGGHVLLVEWPDRAGDDIPWGGGVWKVTLKTTAPECREIRIEPPSERNFDV